MVPARQPRYRRDDRTRGRGPTPTSMTAVPASSTAVAGHCSCGGSCSRCGGQRPGANTLAGNGTSPPASTPSPAPGPAPASAPAPAAPATEPAATPPEGTCATGQPRTSQTVNNRVELHAPKHEFGFDEVTPPCLSCPISPENACPKLGDRSLTPRTATPVQYSWQVRMKALPIAYRGKLPRPKTHVVQKIESGPTFTTGGEDFQACANPYWEAFELDGNGNTVIDYWQAELPDGSAGTWSVKGTCYLTDGLPAGMEVTAGSCAVDLPSTTQEPRKLGRRAGLGPAPS